MKKVLILIYDGYSEMELSFPAASFSLMGGIGYDVVGLDKKEVVGWAGIKTLADKLISEVDPNEYDALFLPGVSPFYYDEFIKNNTVIGLIKKMYGLNKKIITVCLTPVSVGEAGLLKGRKVCSDAPAEQYDGYDVDEVVDQPVVIDGNMIFAKGPGVIWLTKAIYEEFGLKDLSDGLISYLESEGKIAYAK